MRPHPQRWLTSAAYKPSRPLRMLKVTRFAIGNESAPLPIFIGETGRTLSRTRAAFRLGLVRPVTILSQMDQRETQIGQRALG